MTSTSPQTDLTVPPVRTALIVLGMHRSGTSALAGVLGHLGAALPQDLMAPSDMNAKGFFESNRITGLNDRLLAQAGFTWWDPRRFPAAWFDTPEAATLLDEAVEVLRADYGDAALFVMKDPRICRLLPFWTAALDRFGAQVRIVHTHRAAWDVAASLARWAEYEPEFGLVLWSRHVLDAEADSRALPRCFTSFEALMDDWRAVARHIADALDLDWPRGPDQVGAAVDDFLSRDLQHFRGASATGPDGQPLPPVAAELQQVLGAWVDEGESSQDHDRLDRLRSALDASGPLFDGLALRTVHRARQVAHLSGRVESLTADLTQARRDLSRAGQEAHRRDAQIAEQAERLEVMERRQHVASVQLRQLTEQREREMQERLRLAIALDDPNAMADRLDDLAERVERVTAERRRERDRLNAEAEAMATEGARLREDLATARAERDAAQRWGATREAELLASTSWRVTAPLRAVSRVARRLRP